jgi:hypothetical protein
VKTGIKLIADERKRQVESEGWTPEHDDQHYAGELAGAAISYASVAHSQASVGGGGETYGPSAEWQWDMAWWKPSDDPVQNLVKAGALIAAEIDRLQRITANAAGQGAAKPYPAPACSASDSEVDRG